MGGIRTAFTILALLAAPLGCAPRLEAEATDDARDGGAAEDAGSELRSGQFVHRVHADGTLVTVVDATDDSRWQYLDLDSLLADDAPARWDLGFSRFRVRTNGGASGPGGVEVAALEGQDFDALARAPDSGFEADRPDGDEDDDSEPDNAFNSGPVDWYVYDLTTHTLSPREVSYVIASTEASYFKLRIESYYDDAGTPALLAFRWAEIAAPSSRTDEDEDDGAAPPTP